MDLKCINESVAEVLKTARSYTSSDFQYCSFSNRRELDSGVIYAPGFSFGYTGIFVEPYTGLHHTHYRDYDWRTVSLQ
jgi:hypothetical protein